MSRDRTLESNSFTFFSDSVVWDGVELRWCYFVESSGSLNGRGGSLSSGWGDAPSRSCSRCVDRSDVRREEV